MNKRDHKILTQDKKKLAKRLKRKNYGDQAGPMFQPANLHYEMSERSRGIGFGGIGALHTLVTRRGLDEAINQRVPWRKAPVRYFESEHVLNLACHLRTGGTCRKDIDRLREDSRDAEGLSAERIPDPTTAGDFLRRFQEADIERFHRVWLSYWTLTLKLRGRPYAVDEVLGRSQAPIDN